MIKNTKAVIVSLAFCLCLAPAAWSQQNIGINTTGTTADPAALLDLNTGNNFASPNGKGLLIPKVFLTGITNASPLVLTTADTSILIYNRKLVGSLLVPGFYYWKGVTLAWLQLGAQGGWQLLGNAGTSPGYSVGLNFLGTTTNTKLLFGVNATMGGGIDPNGSTFWGYKAGTINTGNGNTGVGYGALQVNTTGYNNTAFGIQALQNNGTGYDNVAIGSIVPLYANTTGHNNIAIGYKVLQSNTTSSNNTDVGNNVQDQPSQTGNNNVALGKNALNLTVSGSSCTGIGYAAANNCTNITADVFLGYGSGNKNASGITMVGNGTGTGIMNNTTVVGDNAFAQASVNFNQATGNTGIGMDAGSQDTNGSFNVYIGAHTGQLILKGSSNTYVGRYSGEAANNESGGTGVGYYSLYYSKGNSNTAAGAFALDSNHHGLNNTACGYWALKQNISGSNNTGTGYYAGALDTAGGENTAFGYEALQNNLVGSVNTAVGYQALIKIKTNSNTGFGYMAGFNDTTGEQNTFIGDSAGYQSGSGVQNTFVGYKAGITGATSAYTNITCLGYQAAIYTASANNSINLGNTSITHICAQVGSITTYSDKRVKDNIQENVPGLAFIDMLRPVTYTINLHKENTLLGIKDDADWPGKYAIENIKQSGFIAQDVDSAARKCGYDFNGLHKPSNPNGLYELGYAYFVVPLVKAVQERQQAIHALKLENQILGNKYTLLSAEYSNLVSVLQKVQDENMQRHIKNQATIATLKEMLKQMQQKNMLAKTNNN